MIDICSWCALSSYQRGLTSHAVHTPCQAYIRIMCHHPLPFLLRPLSILHIALLLFHPYSAASSIVCAMANSSASGAEGQVCPSMVVELLQILARLENRRRELLRILQPILQACVHLRQRDTTTLTCGVLNICIRFAYTELL